MASIVINTEQALADAKSIEKVIQNIETSMKQLDSSLEKELGVTICTNWAYKVLEDWRSVYRTQVPETMSTMQQTATNVRIEAEKWEANSKQQ